MKYRKNSFIIKPFSFKLEKIGLKLIVYLKSINKQQREDNKPELVTKMVQIKKDRTGL